MESGRRRILAGAATALALLPVFLAIWYVAAIPLAWIPGKAALPVIRVASGGAATMALKDRDLVYTVKLEMPYRPGGVPRVAAEVEVAAAKYTYGIALFLALALAMRQSRRPVPILMGVVILVVLPAFGIAFDALKQLGATRGLPPFLAWGTAMREAVALGYQAGTLLLPTLAPVAIWLVVGRDVWLPPAFAGGSRAT